MPLRSTTAWSVRIKSDDFEGKGYQLSPEAVAAHQMLIDARADQAGMN
jgi:hypothetical protein